MAELLLDLEAPREGPEDPDLPPLRGSDKQRPWASAVRKRKLAELDRLLTDWRRYVELLERTGKDARARDGRHALRAARDTAARIRREDTCRWWLDRRDLDARELVAGAPARPGETLHSETGPE